MPIDSDTPDPDVADEGQDWLSTPNDETPRSDWVKGSKEVTTGPLANWPGRASQVFKDPGYIESTKSGELAPRAFSGPEWQKKAGDSDDTSPSQEHVAAKGSTGASKKETKAIRANDEPALADSGSYPAIKTDDSGAKKPDVVDKDAVSGLEARVGRADASAGMTSPLLLSEENPTSDPNADAPARTLSSTDFIRIDNEPLLWKLFKTGLGAYKTPNKILMKANEDLLPIWKPHLFSLLQASKRLESMLSPIEQTANLKVFLFGLEDGALHSMQAGYTAVTPPNAPLKYAAFVPQSMSFKSIQVIIEDDPLFLSRLALSGMSIKTESRSEPVYTYVVKSPVYLIDNMDSEDLLGQIVSEFVPENTVIIDDKTPRPGPESQQTLKQPGPSAESEKTTTTSDVGSSHGTGTGTNSSIRELAANIPPFSIDTTELDDIIIRNNYRVGRHYIIERKRADSLEPWKVGAGAQGTVYKATGETTGRVYALKMILKTGESADVQFYTKEFYKEARNLGKAMGLDFHVPRPSEMEYLKDGEREIPVLPIEFIKSGTLEDKIRTRAGLDPVKWVEYAVNATMRLATTLGKFHKDNLIHRDLKPANIFVGEQMGSNGEPTEYFVVGDMGLSREISEEDVSDVNPEMQAKVDVELSTAKGTLAYAAPEQILMDDITKKVKIRSTRQVDVYGLGAIFYTMLEGRPPHGGQKLVEVMSRFETEKDKHFDRVRPNKFVSEDLAAIVNKCLAIGLESRNAMSKLYLDTKITDLDSRKSELERLDKMEKRYASMDDLLADLQNYKDGKKVEAMDGKYSLKRRIRFWAKTKWEDKIVKGLIIGAAASLGIGGVTGALYLKAAAKAERESRIQDAKQTFEHDDSEARTLAAKLSSISTAAAITSAAKAYDDALHSAQAFHKEEGLLDDPSTKARREMLQARAEELRARSKQAEIAQERQTRYIDIDGQFTKAKTDLPITALSDLESIDSALTRYRGISSNAERDIKKYHDFKEVAGVKSAVDSFISELESTRKAVQQRDVDLAQAKASGESAIASENSGTLSLAEFDYDKAILQFGLAASQTTSDPQEKIRRERLRSNAEKNEREARTERNRQITADTNAYVARINDLFMKKSMRQYVDDTGRFGNDDAGFEKRIDYEREQLRKLLVDPTERLYARLEALCEEKVSDYDAGLKNQIRSLIEKRQRIGTDNSVVETRQRVSTYDSGLVRRITEIDAQTGQLIEAYQRKEYWTVIRLGNATIDVFLKDVQVQESEAHDRAERFASRPDLIEENERSQKRSEFDARVQTLEQERAARKITREQYNTAREQLREAYDGNKPLPK